MKYLSKSAIISPDSIYRYELTRTWRENDRPPIVWIGLNPSTADANQDDPTIRRIVRFSYDWGYGSMVMLNLFAFRATDPKKLMLAADPMGPDNQSHIMRYAHGPNKMVMAWGNHGAIRNVGPLLIRRLTARPNIYCLQMTKAGHPRHPLYVAASTKPAPV